VPTEARWSTRPCYRAHTALPLLSMDRETRSLSSLRSGVCCFFLRQGEKWRLIEPELDQLHRRLRLRIRSSKSGVPSPGFGTLVKLFVCASCGRRIRPELSGDGTARGSTCHEVQAVLAVRLAVPLLFSVPAFLIAASAPSSIALTSFPNASVFGSPVTLVAAVTPPNS